MGFCHNEDNVFDNGNNYNRENDLMDQPAITYFLKDVVNSMLLTVGLFPFYKMSLEIELVLCKIIIRIRWGKTSSVEVVFEFYSNT